MARLLRWILYSIAFLVFLVVIVYATAQQYKPKILQTINQQLKNNVNGDVQIGWLDFTIFEQFPNFTIELGKIYVRGPQYAKYHKDFFTAEKIYVHVNPIRLFQGDINLKSIRIHNSNILIFRDSKGYTNMDVFKKREKDSTEVKGASPGFDLENILFENARITYVDTLKNKSYDITFIKTRVEISSIDSSKHILLNGKMLFGGLTFNTMKGGYLSNTPTDAKLDLLFNAAKQQMIVNPSELQFAKSKVSLSGHFNFTAPGTFSLSIESKGINYAEGLTLITRALREKLKKFNFDGPIDLNVHLLGKLTAGDEPKIDITYSSNSNHFTMSKLEVKELSFAGSFTNHIDSLKTIDDMNSRIALETVSGKISGVSVNSTLTITDLTDPRLLLSSKNHVKLIDINHETDTAHLKFLGGAAVINIEYNGMLNEYLNGPRSVYLGKLKGAIDVENASVMLVTQQKKFEKINAQLHFTEKRMDLDKIDFVVNGNPVQLKGDVSGFIPFFFVPERKGIINLSVYSPRLDLASLNTDKKQKQPESKSGKQSRKKISDLLEVLNSKVEFNIDIKVDELISKKFYATKFSGKVSMGDNQLIANPVTMNLADGEVNFSMKLSALDKPLNPIVLKAEVKGADIKKFFSSFDNFSQKTVQSENLSGKVYTKVNLRAKVDDKFNVLMPSLNGEVDFKLREGELKDFEPLQKMSNFLLKKRDFTDVQFAEIKGTFHIAGQYLDISRMEIESSVLSLFLEGRYSLGDSTDLSIQVPLSNLKKRDKSYKPQNVGVDAKVGPSVFLRAHQNDEGKMVIVYNIFKKFKKG
jgi:AsmA-like C-terminal region